LKKVLIFYACYGGGHISAANSLKECIDKNFNDVEAITIDFMDFLSKTIDKLTTTAYEEMAKKMPVLWGTMYSRSEKGPLAKISSDSNKIMAIKLHVLIKKYNPDFIISTHFFSSQMCAYLKKKNKLNNVKISTVLTDFALHEQWIVGAQYIDDLFVAHIGMKNDLLQKGILPTKVHATGIPLSSKFLINYDKNKIYHDFNLDPNKFTILFFAGGRYGLGKKNTYQILEDIAKYLDNIQVVAISGTNEKMKDNFSNIVKKYNREKEIKVLGFTDRVPELMNISDIVISKPGGLTTSECLSCNLPLIIINPIPGQEEQNAEFLTQNHLAYWVKKSDNPLGVITQLIYNKDKFNFLKENIKNYSKKNASLEICKIILS
jgi:processive 1,2-diacylglycerol beta-glucosyltransferase